MLIIGHRGVRHRGIKENTLLAYNEAIKSGADGVEMDVRCWNKELVISHNRIKKKKIRLLKLEEVIVYLLKSLPRLPNRQAGSFIFNFDVKELGCEKLLVDLIHKYNLQKSCIVDADDPQVIVNLKSLDKNIFCCFTYPKTSDKMDKRLKYFLFRIAWLLLIIGRRLVPRRVWSNVWLIGADGVSLPYPYLTKKFVQELHNEGLKVYAWVVNAPRTVRRMQKMGVDGIKTDKPKKL